MPSLYDPRIQVSIGTGVSNNNAHGTVWTRVVDGKVEGVEAVPFLLSKPQCVRSGLSYIVWSGIVRQFKKLGLDPTHMEIRVGNKHFCYLAGSYREIYSGATGRAVAPVGLT